MLLRQSLKTRTDAMELVNFVGSLQKAWVPPLSEETSGVGGLQMDWLRSEDLKEEKVMTTSNLTIPRQEGTCLFLRKSSISVCVVTWALTSRILPSLLSPCPSGLS